MCELDAARFAAAAGVNLRFDHDRTGSEPCRAFALLPWKRPLRRVVW
jgi:hypothetical protein